MLYLATSAATDLAASATTGLATSATDLATSATTNSEVLLYMCVYVLSNLYTQCNIFFECDLLL